MRTPKPWDQLADTESVIILREWDRTPVMHQWGDVREDAKGRRTVVACGAWRRGGPTDLRYDHARLFCRPCKACARAAAR